MFDTGRDTTGADTTGGDTAACDTTGGDTTGDDTAGLDATGSVTAALDAAGSAAAGFDTTDRVAAGFDAAALGDLGAGLASVGVAGVADDDLFEAAVALERLDAQLAAARCHVLAELEARGACDVEHGLGTAGWLARDANTSGAAARAQVRLARKLRDTLPDVDAALSAGSISVHHARVLADACNPRTTDAIAALQSELLAAAQGVVFEHWKHDVRRVVELVDQDGPHDPNAELARNKLRLSDSLDGLGHLEGSFTAEHWLALKHAVHDRANELFRRYTRDHTLDPDIAVPPRATLMALALVELVRDSLAVDVASTRAPRTELTLILRPTDPHPGNDAGPGGLAGGGLGGEDHLVDRDGLQVPTSVLPMFLCDPDLYTIVTDSLGVPVDMGRKVRTATPAQRRALAARDGGCAFPGCERPIDWCDAHHSQPYETGGHTDLALLVGLCRHHHGVVHRHGWSTHTTDDGWFWFQTPTGRTHWAQRHHKRRTDQPPPPVVTTTTTAA